MRAPFRLRLIAALIAAVFLLGCDENPISGPGDGADALPDADIVIAGLDDEIVLGFGETAYIESEGLWVSFTGMIGDSRCPMDAYCIWPGQAEIELTFERRRSLKDPVVLMLQPGRDPFEEPEIYECSHGYRIYFLDLSPYPSAGHTIPDESYTARFVLVRDGCCCAEGEICFTWLSPYFLQRDSFTLHDASIEGDELTLDVRYGGGCREHGFKLYMQPVFAESNPVRANLYLSHNANGDDCEALISESLTFDVRKIAELHHDQYGGYGDIILEIFGYFTDQPGEGIEILYSP